LGELVREIENRSVLMKQHSLHVNGNAIVTRYDDD
jgi:hypothetical protein